MPPMGNQHAGHVHGAGGAPGAEQQLCRDLAAQIKEEAQEISSPLVAQDPASGRKTKPRACRSKKEAAGAGPSGSVSKKRTKRRRPGRPCKIGPCPEKHMFNRFIHKLEDDPNDFLDIPGPLKSFLKPRFPRTVYLSGRFGTPWGLNLVKRGEDLRLEDGWPKFARWHKMNAGDTLMFTCLGQSEWLLNVFGSDGHERNRS